MTTIIGIKIENKKETSIEVQKVLSEFGCEIRTRLGLNDYKEETCTPNGLILVDVPKQDMATKLIEKLKSIQNVTVKDMEI